MKSLRWLALLLFFSLAFAPGCTPPKSVSATLADTEISLTTAVQVSDNALDAACMDVKSDRCGSALTIHKKILVYANTSYSTLKTARTLLNGGDSAGAMSAIDRVKASIVEINKLIKGG
jgi:hypothetical protein